MLWLLGELSATSTPVILEQFMLLIAAELTAAVVSLCFSVASVAAAVCVCVLTKGIMGTCIMVGTQ